MKILLPSNERPEVSLLPEGIRLGGEMTQSGFLASSLGPLSRPCVAPGAPTRYELTGEYELADMPVWVALQFEFLRLAAILVSRATPGSKTWLSWSRAVEQEKHRAHCEFLEQEYGDTVFGGDWGRISAQYAARGGCSTIVVRLRSIKRVSERRG